MLVSNSHNLVHKKDTQELRAFLATFIQSIIVSKTKIEIHMTFNNVVGVVVPRTGIEPVRRSLSEGF